MADDKTNPLGPQAQGFEAGLQNAEDETFHGTGDGGTDEPWVMGLSAKGRKSWFELMDQEVVDAKFADNFKRILRAVDKAGDPERPTNILLISSSGRNTKLSCAHETARSTKVLASIKKRLKVNARSLNLWDKNIEHCNGCYGSHQSWCHWPCTCWPFDDMIDMYEAFLLADGVVIATPVNEAGAASRFTQMWHRLISMDGGVLLAPVPGWHKSKQQLKEFKDYYGDELRHAMRLANKPFGVVVLGHELGAQTAASQIMASIYYRGGYVPPNCMVPKIYMGSGPNHLDAEVMKSENFFTSELEEELNALAESIVEHAGLYRQLPREVDGGNRT